MRAVGGLNAQVLGRFVKAPMHSSSYLSGLTLHSLSYCFVPLKRFYAYDILLKYHLLQIMIASWRQYVQSSLFTCSMHAVSKHKGTLVIGIYAQKNIACNLLSKYVQNFICME
jgi:hypothetical protein